MGAAALIDDADKTAKSEQEIIDDCEIYVKDYTDCKPEWFWGNQKEYLNFHELLGYTTERIQNEIITTGLKKIEKGYSVPDDDYTLRLYFRQNTCIRVEYWRPMNKEFLACYGHGDDTSFHVYSEHFGKEYPIDLNITYYNFINVVLLGKEPQMCIIARMCPDKMPYVSTTYCRCHE